jgi:hypothetical protein
MGAAGVGIAGPAAAPVIALGEALTQADIMDPIAGHTGLTGAGTRTWERLRLRLVSGPGGACHPLGRGPYPDGYYGPYRF